MMTFSKTCILGILAAVAMVGCVAEEDTAIETGQTEIVTSALEDGSGPTVTVEIPPELSFHQFDDKGDVGIQACNVRLLYCRDPRSTPRKPSYCHNAGCTEQQAARNAFNLCQSNCGAIDCSFMWDLGAC